MSFNHKACAQCGRSVVLEAFVCRHCTYHFSAAEMTWATDRRRKVRRAKLAGIAAAVTVLAFGSYEVQSSVFPADKASTAASGRSDGIVAPPPALASSAGDISAPGRSRPADLDAEAGASSGGVVASSSSAGPSGGGSSGGEIPSVTAAAGTGPAHAFTRVSRNRVELPFPYETGMRASLTIDGTSAAARLTISTDHVPIFCSPTADGHPIRVSIGGAPALAFGCDYPDAADFSTVQVRVPEPILPGIRGGRAALVELQFFNGAPRQFRFDGAPSS